MCLLCQYKLACVSVSTCFVSIRRLYLFQSVTVSALSVSDVFSLTVHCVCFSLCIFVWLLCPFKPSVSEVNLVFFLSLCISLLCLYRSVLSTSLCFIWVSMLCLYHSYICISLLWMNHSAVYNVSIWIVLSDCCDCISMLCKIFVHCTLFYPNVVPWKKCSFLDQTS